MTDELWRWDALVAAAEAEVDGEPAGVVSGFSIDSRTLERGDVFVAISDARDGHEFVSAAFQAGAVSALVRHDYARQPDDRCLLRVDDPLHALERIGAAARARLADDAKIIAVTGSAGKTSSKEMLRTCLETVAPGHVHASVKSYNNHWGAPLTLARMPAATRYGVFEIGMNHAGEITPLTKLVRPHAAVITTVAPVHLGNFSSVDEIAEAKAEIFSGLEPDGVAIINGDIAHTDLLKTRANTHASRVITFGLHPETDVHGVIAQLAADHSVAQAATAHGPVRMTIGIPGAHMVTNALAVTAALQAIGVANLETALAALAHTAVSGGRGERSHLATPDGTILLIDESYNGNPTSVRAALATMALTARTEFPRRVVVLGDLLELGSAAEALHADLAEDILATGVDIVFAAGPLMQSLFETLPAQLRGGWAESAEELEADVLSAVRAGDVVMVKGSLGSRMGPLTRALKARYPTCGGLEPDDAMPDDAVKS
ncbi:MAG: UDP-N-acetylmuramoyl-tripeptide--D-alanyl-D-alanine ligase [Pseudomonadota bacterium]